MSLVQSCVTGVVVARNPRVLQNYQACYPKMIRFRFCIWIQLLCNSIDRICCEQIAIVRVVVCNGKIKVWIDSNWLIILIGLELLTYMNTALWLNVVNNSSSISVPLESCEFIFCTRKCWSKLPESVLLKLPDCDIICQLPTEDMDSFLCRDNDIGTLTGLVLLQQKHIHSMKFQYY